MSEPLVKMTGVSRHHGAVRALDGVDLEIRAGEWLAVMGPSGSGKTTLVNLLAALDRPTEGTIVVDGIEVSALGESERVRYRREKVGVVFQQFHLFPYLDALENVMVAKHYHSIADAPEALRALERVGLGDRAHHLPSPRAANSSACAWRARSSTSRGCCSRTNRPATSTPKTKTPCSRSCASCIAKATRS
jgi:putative ABC transport system ATP-binding protein